MAVRRSGTRAVLGAACGLALAVGAVAPATAAEAEVVHETLSTGDDLFVYVPADTDNGYRAASTPILLVFASASLDQDDARALVEDGGFDDIAAREQGVVAVLGPESGVWRAGDQDVVTAVLSRFGDATGEPYDQDGQLCAAAGPPGSPVQCLFPGTKARVYVFADGDAADFVHQNVVAGVDVVPPFPGHPGQVQTWTPTAVFTSNATADVVAPSVAVEVPAYLVNAPAAAVDAFAALNDQHGLVASSTSSVTDGFDPAAVSAGYDAVIEHAISRVTEVNDWFQTYAIPDYAAEGIAVTHESPEINGAPLEYFEYLPDTADENGMPLVMVFHGGGNHAEYMMWSTAWPQLAKEGGFMVVSVNRHVDRSAADMVALLDLILDEHPGIDESRIYASGFSMGSVKTWMLSEEFADRFAAFAPMNGSFQNGEGAEGLLTPAIYFAGLSSPLPERPHQAGEPNDIDTRLASLFAQNDVTDSYVFDPAVDPVWGIASNASRTVEGVFDGVSVKVDGFESSDGIVYTALAAVTNGSHEALPVQARLAWDFMSQFSRSADGSILVGEAAPGTGGPAAPPGEAGDELAPTGAEPGLYAILGAGLLLAGSIFAAAAWRRRRVRD